MIKHTLVVLLGAMLLALVTSQANAAVILFDNDQVGFDAAMGSNALLGVEDFEGSTIAPTVFAGVDDPRTESVANGPYPFGLVVPMTVQSNLGAGMPAVPDPRGVDGLIAAAVGVGTTVSDVVVATPPDSLDLIFDPADEIVGLGFNPLSGFVAGLLEIRVFDTANVLLAMTTTSDPASLAAATHFGIQLTGGDFLGRVNIFSPTNQFEGGDNIALYQVPEPMSLALLVLGAFGVMGARRPRRYGYQDA